MDALKEIGYTFKELAKCFIAFTDANSCLMWRDIVKAKSKK
jgi:hypothetical protein